MHWGSNYVVPIEPILKTSKTPSGVHICIQGVAWTEQVYGPIPVHHFEQWIGHYSRYGITDFHVYTNSTELLEVFLKSRSPKASNVWFHESAYPQKHHSYSYLLPFETRNRGIGYNALQWFVMNDCIARAKAMNAAYALMYALPHSASRKKSTCFFDPFKMTNYWIILKYGDSIDFDEVCFLRGKQKPKISSRTNVFCFTVKTKVYLSYATSRQHRAGIGSWCPGQCDPIDPWVYVPHWNLYAKRKDRRKPKMVQ